MGLKKKPNESQTSALRCQSSLSCPIIWANELFYGIYEQISRNDYKETLLNLFTALFISFGWVILNFAASSEPITFLLSANKIIFLWHNLDVVK